MRRILFIVNPKSGKANIKNGLLGIVDIFTKHECITTVYVTQRAKEATEKVENLDGVGAGVMELDKKIPIGYIPSGSTNDFAKSMGISSDNLEAATTVMEGSEFRCDVGFFNDS